MLLSVGGAFGVMMGQRFRALGLAVLVGLLGPLVEAGLELPGAVFLAQSAEASAAEASTDTLFARGLAQMEQADLSKALQSFEQVLAQQQASGDRLGEATVLTQIGKLLAWQGKYERSVEQLQTASQLWNELGQPARQAEALAWLGNSYRLQAQSKPAEARLREAIALSQSVQDPLREAEALWFLGATFAQQDWSKASETIAQALRLMQAAPATPAQQRLEGRILAWVGLAAAQQDKAEQALADLEAALAIQRDVGDRLMERVTLELLGGLYRGQGQLEASLEAYQGALAIAQVMQVPAVMGQMQNQVGIAHYRLEQYPAALSAFEQAAEAYEAEEEQREAIAQVWSNIGDTHYQQNQLEAMATAYEKAASIYGSVGKLDSFMNHLANQAVRELRTIDAQAKEEAAIQEQEKFTKQLAYADVWIKLSRNTNSAYHQIRSLFFLATLQGQKNVFEMLNNRFEAAIQTALREQEINQQVLDRIKAAENFSEKQSEIDLIENSLRRSFITIPVSISTAYSQLGEPQEAVKFAQMARIKAENLGDQGLIESIIGVEELAYQTLAGWYEGKLDYQEAIRAYQKSLDLVPEDLVSKERDSYFVTLISLGQIHERLGNYDEAERYYQRASQLSSQFIDQESEEHEPEDDRFWSQSQASLASVYAARGEYRQAIDLLESAISQRESSGKGKNYMLLSNLSTYYVEVGEMQPAEALQEEIIQHNRTEYQNYLEDFNSSSWDFFCKDQPKDNLCQIPQSEITPFSRRLLTNRVSIELSLKQYLLALSLSSRGVLQREQGEYQNALQSQQTALSLIQDEEDKALEASILSDQASIYQDQAQYQLAYDRLQDALAIAEAQQDISAQLQYSRAIANIYAEQGQFQQALDIHNKNLQTARTIGLRPIEAATLYQIGYTQGLQGNYAKALASYEQALALQRDMGDQRDIAVTLNAIGLLYRRLGQVNQALNLHSQSLEMSQQLNNKQFVVASLQFLGAAYHDAGQLDEAQPYFQQALDLNQDIGNRFRETFILEALAKLHLDQQQPEQAIAALEKSLSLSQQMKIRPTQARILGLLGEAYSQQQSEQALDALQRSLTIAQSIENQPTEAQALSRLGDLYSAQSSELAIAFYKQSVSTYETIRADLRQLPIEQQQSYTQTVESTYRTLADLLLQQDRILEAQQVLDLLKVQELEDYLHNTRSSDSDELIILKPEQEILDRYQTLLTSAIALGQELSQLQQKNRSQELSATESDRLTFLFERQTELNQQFNSFLQSSDIAQLLDQLKTTEEAVPLEQFDDLRRHLSEIGDAALFYPLVLGDRLELILTTASGAPLRRSVNVSRSELNAAILELRQALQDPTRDAKAPAQKLHQWLIQPIQDDLTEAGITTLLYAPDGQLRYIPLAALYDETQPEGKQWLVQRFQVNNITASSLTKFGTASQPELSLLAGAFSDTSISHTVTAGTRNLNFRGLPFAGREVELLKQTLPQARTFFDSAFSLSRLKPQMNGFSIIHLATHAAFVPGEPEDSFILFGDGSTANLRDIENWDLQNVDLVVLSACETGVGIQALGQAALGDGKEVLGLGYQFQNRGARATLASLWQVDDGGTQLLMNAFYAALDQGMTKAEALQAAQQALISSDYETVDIQRAGVEVVSAGTGRAISDTQLSHPYYWAPFILIGNGF